MRERLQKLMAASGLCSRRSAEEMIKSGRVRVNGAVAVLGDCGDIEYDTIEIDGAILPRPPKMVYIMLNKPRGCVTTMSDEKGRRCVTELIKDCPTKVFPVGRLDMFSEGLLLFTNDGETANRLMHPRFEHEKIYRVTVHGDIEYGTEQLNLPIELDGRIVCGRAVGSGERTIDITVHEGINHQIRRMCASVGLKVERLVRISEAGIALGDLKTGAWRYLTEAELAHLKFNP